jgi:hypothetical protein
VAGQEFAPGQYDVKETETGIITLQGQGKAVAVLSTPLTNLRTGKSPAIRFTNSNNKAYLTSVSMEGEGTRSVPAHLPTEQKVMLAAQ